MICETTCLSPKLGQLYCLRTRLWTALVSGKRLLSFLLPKQWTEDMLLYQSNPVGVRLFLCKQFLWLHVTYFAHRNLSQQTETTHFLLWFIQQKAALVWSKRRGFTTRSAKLQLSVRMKVEHISWRHVYIKSLNALKPKTRLSATVHNKLPRHSKARNIAHSKESTWTNMDMTSFAPESLWRRANARNVSFRISLRWPIHIINWNIDWFETTVESR